MALGVISGSGLYDFDLLADSVREEVKTPYGEALIYRATVGGEDICFLPRHGKQHSVLPHMINYRANICALKQAGVNEIMAFCCVGSLTRDLPPGSLVMPAFIGHSIGLEIDEPPVLWERYETIVQAGMVLALEIEVSAPQAGLGVKLEDTVVVRESGWELLTGLPRELVECGA